MSCRWYSTRKRTSEWFAFTYLYSNIFVPKWYASETQSFKNVIDGSAGIILKCLVTFIPWYAYIIRTVVITIVDVALETVVHIPEITFGNLPRHTLSIWLMSFQHELHL
jgi:hypothetical protein